MKPRVSDACAYLSPRCEQCECWERAVVYPPGTPFWWLRSCEKGYRCSAGMVCREFKAADPHAVGRLF